MKTKFQCEGMTARGQRCGVRLLPPRIYCAKHVHQRPGPVQCWPNGHAGGPCDHFIPDNREETMKSHGWGFVEAPDRGSRSGTGPFYACPWHRDYIDPGQRQAMIALYCKVIGKTEEELP